jgi:hypothetical protein
LENLPKTGLPILWYAALLETFASNEIYDFLLYGIFGKRCQKTGFVILWYVRERANFISNSIYDSVPCGNFGKICQ